MRLPETLQRILSAFRSDPAPEAKPFREAVGTTIDADEDQWRRLSGDSRRDLAPLTQARMRELALYLWERNLLANRMIELPLAYLLAEGVELRSDDEGAQQALTAFWNDPINAMDLKLEKKVRDLALTGELCWPAFTNDVDGAVRLGYLDPALIETVVVDPDNAEQPVGIVTVKDKKGQARRYRVIVNGPETVFTARTQGIRETFADGDCFFFTINDLSSGRRGRSDLTAPGDWCDAYDEYLYGEMERADHLRAFVWHLKLTGADKPTVEARAKTFSSPSPGSAHISNENEELAAIAPQLNAADSDIMARLMRNHVLGGATLPEHWFGGGGDVNRAVGAEMGEPTFKVFSMRQRRLKYILEAVGTYVLRQAWGAGQNGEPKPDDPALHCEAVFPELTARDTTKWAAAMQQVVAAAQVAVQAGLMTEETAVQLIAAIAGRLGVEIDPKQELADAKKAADERRAEQQEADTFTGPKPADINPEDVAANANAAAGGAAAVAGQA